MNRSVLIVALAFSALSTVTAKAEVRTITIDGVTVTYVITTPKRGAAMSTEEINDHLSKAKPATVMPPSVPQLPDSH
jgi:hypothetical protein